MIKRNIAGLEKARRQRVANHKKGGSPFNGGFLYEQPIESL